MVDAKYQYTTNSVMVISGLFINDVLITMYFKGEEVLEKFYKVYFDAKKGYYFRYKTERIYLNQFN